MNQRVYYADTDAYGVVWHGTYVRWMELARVEFCRELGINFVELKSQGIMTPVTNLSIRYKSPAMIDEPLTVETYIKEIKPLTILFTQIVKNAESGQVHIIGEVEVVAVNNEGKIYRKIPEVLRIPCEQAMNG